jgi:hypothetical protein
VNFSTVEKIAAAVLYEGYILYPYRATSTKNVQRWNFGTLYPQSYAEAQRPAESFRMVSECLLEAEENAQIDARVRFLQLARRRSPTSADWEEGIERSTTFECVKLRDILAAPLHNDFSFHACDTVTHSGMAGESNSRDIFGRMSIRAEQIAKGIYKVSVEVVNLTPLQNPALQSRNDALLEAFVSAHVLLGVIGGQFVSLLDPPEYLSEAAGRCRNVGVFPVLVGEDGQRSMMLCSPIILYDYPQIAPESAGDFFDGTEMDEMLALRVLTLTDEEKQEMRGVDDRARKILERTETLPQDFLMKVHGAIRGMHPVSENSLQKERK